jgi:hypothetical protein
MKRTRRPDAIDAEYTVIEPPQIAAPRERGWAWLWVALLVLVFLGAEAVVWTW